MSKTTDQKPRESGPAAKWVGYRPEIRVLDCTIRDGGLMNDHRFSLDLVRAVYQTCCEAGIDYMEVGYKASRHIYAPDEYGNWKFSSEDDIRRVVGEKQGAVKISVMADVDRTDYHEDIPPREKSVVDMVRVACYIHQIPTALDMIKDAHDKGYETTVNLMAVSVVRERELDEALELFADSEANVLYLVDSFGALYSEQIHYLVGKYLRYARQSDKQVGIHAHNNLELAFANTVEAIIKGANMLDASLAGLGRGAGNCRMELLLGFLHNPKYKLRPVLKCIQEHIEPLRKDLLWGFDHTYMLTGFRNLHPRAAIKHNASPEAVDKVKFFDELVDEQ
ncbi:MAG: aldolase catalytic domain-containing protein [bacterium]|nr:aldolase catalytic domain-containing protein [bacterium]